jgi:hypothetical protein
MVGGGISPPIINLSTSLICQFHASAAYQPRTRPQYPLNISLGVLQRRFGSFGERSLAYVDFFLYIYIYIYIYIYNILTMLEFLLIKPRKI